MWVGRRDDMVIAFDPGLGAKTVTLQFSGILGLGRMGKLWFHAIVKIQFILDLETQMRILCPSPNWARNARIEERAPFLFIHSPPSSPEAMQPRILMRALL